MNFNNLDFESASQSTIDLTHKNAHLNFNNNQAVISSGTELNLGLGTLSGSNLVFDSDSLVTFTMSNKEGSAEPLVKELLLMSQRLLILKLVRKLGS